MLHVSLEAPTPSVSGINDVGNDAGKALSRQAYHEATETVRVLVPVWQREC